MASIAHGKNEKIWEWLESLGVDYGRMREIMIEVNTDCYVTVMARHVGKESYCYRIIAHGANRTPEFLDWIHDLGIRHSTHLQIELDAGSAVTIHADMYAERDLLEKLPDVLHLGPVEKEEQSNERERMADLCNVQSCTAEGYGEAR